MSSAGMRDGMTPCRRSAKGWLVGTLQLIVYMRCVLRSLRTPAALFVIEHSGRCCKCSPRNRWPVRASRRQPARVVQLEKNRWLIGEWKSMSELWFVRSAPEGGVLPWNREGTGSGCWICWPTGTSGATSTEQGQGSKGAPQPSQNLMSPDNQTNSDEDAP